MPLGPIAGLGALAGGMSAGLQQGFNQERLSAIQQAYVKMQMQHQEMLAKQMEFTQNQAKANSMAAPFEKIAERGPEYAQDVSPAITGIRNPQSASFAVKAPSFPTGASDPSLLERPEEQPVMKPTGKTITGQAAIPDIMKEAYAKAGQRGQAEYNNKIGMHLMDMQQKNAMKEATLAQAGYFKALAESHRQDAEERAKTKMGQIPPKEFTQLQAQNRAVRFMGALENVFADPSGPKTGAWAGLRTNPEVIRIANFAGIDPATADETTLASQLGAHLPTYIKANFTRSAGWEVPLTEQTIPRMFLPNEVNLRRARALKQMMIRDHEQDLQGHEQMGRVVPPALRDYTTRTPAETLGRSVQETPPAQTTGAATPNLGVFPGLEKQKPGLDLQPGWVP
jgi:hypothetical protein